MSDKLEIQNLGKESKREIVGEECMPQPPFRLCLVGSSLLNCHVTTSSGIQ